MRGLRRWLGLCATAAWLAGLYVLYAQFVTPRIEPFAVSRPVSPMQRLATAADTRPLDNVEVARDVLADQPWTATAEIQLQFGDMYLYANRCDQLEKLGEVRFEPFAVVWKKMQGQQPADPFRITSEAAVIRFEKPFDLEHPQPGRPIAGALHGEVIIRGPDNLLLHGHSFLYEEQSRRMWSDRELSFTFGPHSGSGHGVQLDFDKPPEGIDAESPAIGLLTSLSLLRKVAVVMRGDASDPLTKRATSLGANAPTTGLKPGEEIQITGEGRLQYQVGPQMVLLDRNVQVQHPQPDGSIDTLSGELLQLELRPVTETHAVADTPAPGTKPAPPRPWEIFEGFRPEPLRLTASGSVQQPVQFASPSKALSGTGESIAYDLLARTVTFSSKSNVEVRQGTNVIRTHSVTAELAEPNVVPQIQMASAAGDTGAIPAGPAVQVSTVRCVGPGTIEARRPDGQLLTASWNEELLKTFDEERGCDRVELRGAAHLQQPGEFGITGQNVVCWWRAALPAAPVIQAANAPTSTNSPWEDSLAQGHLERAEATGDVVFTHPRLTLHTQKLGITLHQQALPSDLVFQMPEAARGPAPGQRGTKILSRTDSITTPATSTKTPPAPVQATADELELIVWQDPHDAQQVAIAHLAATGRVDVRQVGTVPEKSLRLQGERLEADQRVAQQAFLKLTGAPGLVQLGGSRLEAAIVEWSQAEGLVRVPGPGSLQHPIQSRFDGQKLNQPQQLVLNWKEKLEFDGQTAHVYEKVQARIEHSSLRCYAMHVTLREALPLNPPRLETLTPGQTEIATVTCESQVELDDAEYEHDRLISIRRGRLGRFVLDNVTGKTEAQGRGWLMHWTRGAALTEFGKKPGGKDTAKKTVARTTTQPAAPPKAAAQNAEGWTYLRVDFTGLMRGNLHEQFTTFDDGVEVVYGPVQHATDRIDPDHLPENGAWMRSESLRLTRVSDPGSKQGGMTLLATGNTELEAMTFHARADSIKYDELKGLYIIQSLGANKATIRKQPTANDPRGFVSAQRFTVNPALSHFHVDQFISGGVISGP